MLKAKKSFSFLPSSLTSSGGPRAEGAETGGQGSGGEGGSGSTAASLVCFSLPFSSHPRGPTPGLTQLLPHCPVLPQGPVPLIFTGPTPSCLAVPAFTAQRPRVTLEHPSVPIQPSVPLPASSPQQVPRTLGRKQLVPNKVTPQRVLVTVCMNTDLTG